MTPRPQEEIERVMTTPLACITRVVDEFLDLDNPADEIAEEILHQLAREGFSVDANGMPAAVPLPPNPEPH